MTPENAGSEADPDSTDSVHEHIQYHRDGSVWARGPQRGEIAEGYWEWFRKDGSLMRSGTFTAGVQSGQWTTYDATGKPYKVTQMKPRD